ncbi:unnamed protein product [Gordionus sp. m RMFG-2023]
MKSLKNYLNLQSPRTYCLKSRCNIPLSKPLPYLPNIKYFNENSQLSNETKITKLSNGLTVATENRFGHFCTVGVVIDSGSRYEVAYPSGINHFLEKLSFNSTNSYKDKDHILREFEKQCGIFDCQSSRDTLIYAASAEIKGLEKVFDIISEIVLQPNFTEDEAAYRDNTLGLPKLCPKENIPIIDRKLLYTYMRDHFIPERIVIAGVGIEHDALLEVVHKTFLRKIPTWEGCKELTGVKIPGFDGSVAQYTGGIRKKEKDMSDISLGPNPLPELAHCVIGLEGVAHSDPTFVPACVLNAMMGGGGSFSAGGPGKGMYSRLYLNVLNIHHWIFNATAYNHSYSDTGLFCVHASAHPSQLAELAEVVLKELTNMTKSVSQTELERSKKQLQSMLMMNLESRPVVFEDIGRQVLANGSRKLPQQLLNEISKVSEEDIVVVAQKFLASKPSVAALGTLKQLPSYEQIQHALLDKNGKISQNSRYGSIFA